MFTVEKKTHKLWEKFFFYSKANQSIAFNLIFKIIENQIKNVTLRI